MEAFISIHKQCGVYFESLLYQIKIKDPASFLIQLIFSLYQGLKRGPSGPKADDKPMCRHASPWIEKLINFKFFYLFLNVGISKGFLFYSHLMS